MHRDPCHLPVNDLALARMQPGSQFDLESAHLIHDCARASDRPSGPVEACEEAISYGIHLPAAEAHKLTPYQCMMLLEQLAPRAITECGCTLARADDVGEEHSGKDT